MHPGSRFRVTQRLSSPLDRGSRPPPPSLRQPGGIGPGGSCRSALLTYSYIPPQSPQVYCAKRFRERNSIGFVFGRFTTFFHRGPPGFRRTSRSPSRKRAPENPVLLPFRLAEDARETLLSKQHRCSARFFVFVELRPPLRCPGSPGGTRQFRLFLVSRSRSPIERSRVSAHSCLGHTHRICLLPTRQSRAADVCAKATVSPETPGEQIAPLKQYEINATNGRR